MPLSTKEIAKLGLMLAIIVALTTIESMFSPMPHIKPGLANIVILYCALGGKYKEAVILNVLKAIFVFLIRGAMAGLLSLCGGLLSVVVIILLARSKNASCSLISVSGAVAHNFGQLAIIMLLLATPALGYYMPVLLISGGAAGLLTGAIYKLLGERLL